MTEGVRYLKSNVRSKDQLFRRIKMGKLGIILKTIKCKRCGKKVEVLEITGGGSITKYAPCKNCNCENMISEEKWERGPAEVDLRNNGEVIQYIRDLLNLSNLLENGFNAELLVFIRKLKLAGYTDDRIHQFITYAGYNTRYGGGAGKGVEMDEEYELGCGKDVPRAMPNNGDQREWRRIKRAHK